jgi:single-stranded DNA-binding protein
MITLTGNGRPTRDPQLRTTHSGKTVATISVASDRRDRNAEAIYVDLIVWEGQATAAAQHLIKGQAVSFSGRFDCATTSPNPATSASRSSFTASTSSTAPSPAARSRSPTAPTSRPRRRAGPTPTTSRFVRRFGAGRQADGPPRSRACDRVGATVSGFSSSRGLCAGLGG